MLKSPLQPILLIDEQAIARPRMMFEKLGYLPIQETGIKHPLRWHVRGHGLPPVE
jgi:hypothetical protein